MPEVWYLSLHPNRGLKTTLTGNTAREVKIVFFFQLLIHWHFTNLLGENHKCLLRNTDSQALPQSFGLRRP